jgi:2-hydroxy-3-oxopropionate reductase
MVGAETPDFTAAMPVFAALGKTIVHVGPPGAGQIVKAANQLLVAGSIQLVAEAIVFLEAQGADLEAAITVLRGGLAGNAVLERKAPAMLAHNFEPGFRLELHHKDLGIYQAAARQAGVASPVGALVGQLVGSMVAQGHGRLDHSALLALVEQLSGRSAAE